MDSSPVNNYNAVILHYLLYADVKMCVADRVNANEVDLADFIQKFRDPFIKLVMAGFDAIGVANRPDPDLFVGAPATASSGGFGLAMRTSPGLSRTGTLRCISILAAADEAMLWPRLLAACQPLPAKQIQPPAALPPPES